MRARFSKMHGLGNDFVVFDSVTQPLALSAATVRRLADRRLGIGCDQILVVEPARSQGVDFHYRIFNANGGEVAQCGNGARCFARFVLEQGLTDKRQLTVATAVDTIGLTVGEDYQIRVDMGRPRLRPDQIPLEASGSGPLFRLQLAGAELEIGAVSMGNPHAVLRVGAVEVAPVESIGPGLESHPAFPERANVSFMEVVDRSHIRLRVYERGVGETLACGSGACAAVVSGQLQSLLNRRVTVSLAGGDLEIEWAGGEHSVYMTGPAEHVFDGQIEL